VKRPIAAGARCLVTGGSSGLGRAFCLELAARGARVLIADRDTEGARETCRLALAEGAREAHFVRCDVSSLHDVEAVAKELESLFGGVDVVVNNAGVGAGGVIGEAPIKDWQWVLGINLYGVIYGCHVFAPRLRAQRAGHVINVASAAGLLCTPEMGAYNVSKAGVVALSETLASELAPVGVHVTVLCPSFFPTNIVASSRGLDDKRRAMGEKLMRRATLDARGMARLAIAAVEEGELYAVPPGDARWLWRIKRASPQGFRGLLARAFERLRKP
jgi:NAD(P)-dependent dehydrogenase (short-subunit alcohol dehydrogenase family)